MLNILLYAVGLEIIFYILVVYIRSKNQWFITSKDKNPIFTKNVLKKVLEKSYDPLLGWDRKANTFGIESSGRGTVSWSINCNGARNNLEYNEQKSYVSIFGDSFTFSREVNDNEAWGYKLSRLLNLNVQNFGVGNYGFDQALIKLNHKLESQDYRPEIVIIGVVPDTLSRILSVWKHYYEYGNIFGFKPRYILKNNKIKLIKNCIDSKEKFDKIEQYLLEIQENDYFYRKKFLKEVIKFPYTLNFIKNFKRNIVLTYETILNGDILKPTETIMRNNLNCRIKLYNDEENINLLSEELKLFEILSQKYKFKPYFLIMPQKDDINYIKENHHHFYEQLENKIPSGIEYIDIYSYFKEFNHEELNNLYSENSKYGGHFNISGNQLIADIVYKRIKQDKYEKSL